MQLFTMEVLWKFIPGVKMDIYIIYLKQNKTTPGVLYMYNLTV